MYVFRGLRVKQSKGLLEDNDIKHKGYTIIKVVQATHHQGDIRYGSSWGIQYSCMSLMSITWTFFRSPALWDKLICIAY